MPLKESGLPQMVNWSDT